MITEENYINAKDFKTNSLLDLNHQFVIDSFNAKGCIVFKGFNIDPKDITSFTDTYSHSYSTDTIRRKSRLGEKQIKSVDAGNGSIKLHSEASFTTTWPEILWFFCKTPPSKNGATTICDGIKLWESLSKSTRSFFYANPVVYDLEIPVLRNPKSGKGKKPWAINHIAASESFIDWDKGSLFFKFTRYAVHESRFPKKFCFSNHLFVDLETEPQILSRKLQSGNDIPKDIYTEINQIADQLTQPFQWEASDLMMLDNKRFLHGRESFEMGDQRDIVSVQTEKASFPYDASWRKSRAL